MLETKRQKLLSSWNKWFETPLIILAFIWLVLIVIELVNGLNPLFEILSFSIWIIFVLDYLTRFFLSPIKKNYLKENWLGLLVLLFPALKLFSLLRLTKSIYLVRIFSSMHHTRRILGFTLGRHGFNYILTLTLVVIIIGAAGMYAFEADLKNYGNALWWTAMMITTMGSDFWPKTLEGRVLCLGLAIYSFAIFGYITAIVATFLIEKDNKVKEKKFETKILEELNKLYTEIQNIKIPK